MAEPEMIKLDAPADALDGLQSRRQLPIYRTRKNDSRVPMFLALRGNKI